MAPAKQRVSRARRPPVPESEYPRPDVDACWAAMKMILNRTRHMFNCRTTLTEESNEQDVQRIKTIFRKTQKEHETRYGAFFGRSNLLLTLSQTMAWNLERPVGRLHRGFRGDCRPAAGAVSVSRCHSSFGSELHYACPVALLHASQRLRASKRSTTSRQKPSC